MLNEAGTTSHGGWPPGVYVTVAGGGANRGLSGLRGEVLVAPVAIKSKT